MDEAYSVLQNEDGGYTVVGSTCSFGTRKYSSVYFIRTNAEGDAKLTRTYGWNVDNYGAEVQRTADDGYIIAGCTYDNRTGNTGDVYVVKTNSQGDTLWNRTYGGPNEDLGNSVRQTTDGGYIIAGWTYFFDPETTRNYSIYLVRTDAAGDTLWTRVYGDTIDAEAHSVLQTSDGCFVVAGRIRPLGAARSDVCLIKASAAGDVLWTRTYGGSDDDAGNSVQQTTDGGYIIAGWTSSFGDANGDVYLIRTDSLGDTLWTRTYGWIFREDGFSVQQTADGGYFLVGRTESFNKNEGNVYVIKTDAWGDTLWTRTYGGWYVDMGRCGQQTADGGYIIAGYTLSFGSGKYDAYLIKTDSSGDFAAVDESPDPQTQSRKPAATVVRNLPPGETTFDVAGRRVQHPKPGVYFVREEPQASSRKPQAVRKVLLVR